MTEFIKNAGVAELADAQASGACGRKIVWVQVPSPAFFFCKIMNHFIKGLKPSFGFSPLLFHKLKTSRSDIG